MQKITRAEAIELLTPTVDNVEVGDMLVDHAGVARVEHVYQRGEHLGFIRVRRPVHQITDPSGWARRCENIALKAATRCNRHGFPLATCLGRAHGYKQPTWLLNDCQVTKRDEQCSCPRRKQS